MATYKTKENIQAKGYVNEISIPYKGKSLQKTFDKGVVFNGTENNSFGETMIIFEENPATNTIDKDTKFLYDGKAQFAIDPTKVEKLQNEVKKTNTLLSGQIVDSPTLSIEDKFYQKLGIEKSSGNGWGIQSRPLGRMLVIVALVAGYFAYKKFKK